MLMEGMAGLEDREGSCNFEEIGECMAKPKGSPKPNTPQISIRTS